MDLNQTLAQVDLTDMHRPFHPTAAENMPFSSAHGTFSGIDHMIRHKTNLGKIGKSKSYQVFFPTAVV